MRYAKKSLGQNFLIDSNIIKKIINLTNVFNKNILEIGPGKGALTDEILRKKPKSLILIEKDSAILRIGASETSDKTAFTLALPSFPFLEASRIA